MDATNDMTGVDTAVIASIADKLFQVMPLLRKRMLRLDGMQAGYHIPPACFAWMACRRNMVSRFRMYRCSRCLRNQVPCR